MKGLLVAMAAFALLLGGCGESSDSDSTLTKAEYIKQADAVCKQISEEVADEYGDFAKAEGIESAKAPSKQTGRTLAVEIYLPAMERRVDQLRELEPPAGDEKKIEAVLVATEDGVARAKKNPEILLDLDRYPFEEARKLSEKYGFTTCEAF